jgi:hypothetical protein
MSTAEIREKLLARKADAEVQRRLIAIDLVLGSSEIQALIRRYRVSLTEHVDWKASVANVDQSKTVGDQLNNASSSEIILIKTFSHVKPFTPNGD